MTLPTDPSPLRRKHNVLNYQLAVTNISELIFESDWVKAVFYREPLSRFLSAYRSKCNRADADGAIWCTKAFGDANVSFHDAVSQIYMGSISNDPHFAKQSQFCGGLHASLQYYQFKYELDRASTRDNFIRILDSVRLPYRGKSAFAIKVNKLLPPVEVDKHRNVPRFTQSSKVLNLLKFYNRQCYIRAIVDYYQVDYDLFKINYPKWAVQALGNTSHEKCDGLTY